jgi:ATP-dependent Lhr-like helicase
MAACDLNEDEMRAAIGELVVAGLVSSDGFAGLRVILRSSRPPTRSASAGRWFALRGKREETVRAAAVETWAWTLLRRYGVIFRRLLARETADVPWRDLARIYRRLEARGEIRGGRFVSGMSGEQFALPEAVDRLREVRRSAPDGRLMTISAADPLNLTGILSSDDRIRTSAANRIVYRHGVAIAAMEGDFLRVLATVEREIATEAAAAAAGRRVPVLSGYVGRYEVGSHFLRTRERPSKNDSRPLEHPSRRP